MSDFASDRECTTHHACDCIQAKVGRLEAALRVATDDLYKAANQFQGLMPEGENWRIFEGKARRAELQIAPDSPNDSELERKVSIFLSSPDSAGLGEDNRP
jgi:hypothetical protein